MFHSEDRELVRFFPFVGLLLLSFLLGLILSGIVTGRDLLCPDSSECHLDGIYEALDNPVIVAPCIVLPHIVVAVLSFTTFRSPSARRLVAYHVSQVVQFTFVPVLPMFMFLIKGDRYKMYNDLGPLVYVIRAMTSLISGLGLALLLASFANLLKQNKFGGYFRLSVESQPTQGFYGMIRHPILCGVLVISVSNTVFSGDFGYLVACAALCIEVYLCMRNQDAAKLRCGNDGVCQYIQRTPRLWPTRADWVNYFRGQSIARGLPMPLASDDSVEMCAPDGAAFDEPLPAFREKSGAVPKISLLDQVVVALEEDSGPSAAKPGTLAPKARSPRPGSPRNTTDDY
eukprot:TRINITY_DN5797_c0_g1_i1.p1 TRINITY_DN5797_c0_g1~~TRINITY_DN5797_c0_g1_i1.p1  ORF type:complete len:351 (-),score=78.83 TRINITY_DN5797_c0_g1_i1:447-1475(-)